MSADIDARLIGYWTGDARLIMDWAKQPRLAVALQIRSDGSVEGRVGDAVIVAGVVRPNRGVLGRLLNLNTDFIVRGRLSGEVLRRPSTFRAQLSMPFNVSNGELRGSVFTNGAKTGSPGHQQVVGADMLLKRR